MVCFAAHYVVLNLIWRVTAASTEHVYSSRTRGADSAGRRHCCLHSNDQARMTTLAFGGYIKVEQGETRTNLRRYLRRYLSRYLRAGRHRRCLMKR